MNSILHELTRENAAAWETGVEQGARKRRAEMAEIPQGRPAAGGAVGVPMVKESAKATDDGTEH